MQDRMCIFLSTGDSVLDHGISATVVLPAACTRFVRIKTARGLPATADILGRNLMLRHEPSARRCGHPHRAELARPSRHPIDDCVPQRRSVKGRRNEGQQRRWSLSRQPVTEAAPLQCGFRLLWPFRAVLKSYPWIDGLRIIVYFKIDNYTHTLLSLHSHSSR
jgi:hypothetical protein